MKYGFLALSIFMVCSASNLHALALTNNMQGIYHEKNKDKNCLEIGHIVLFFARSPQGITLKPEHQVLSNGMHQLTFVFDNTQVVQDVLNKVNPSKGDGYTIQFDAQNKSLRLVIMYDPQKVEVQYGDYSTLDMKKGYIIRFFDHNVLSQINNKESYILQTAASEIYPIRLLA